jgi:antirestriction protein
MAILEISFNFSCGNGGDTICEDWEAASGLSADLDGRADELLGELNADPTCEWTFNEWEVSCYEDEYADPADFSDLDEYGAYVEKCDEHGEGYRLRYADIGDSDFQNAYCGCWTSDEEFVESVLDDCYEIPNFLVGYVNIEKLTRDWMMDYSSYEGSEGCHIFRD